MFTKSNKRNIKILLGYFYWKAYVRMDMIIYDGIAYNLKLNVLLKLTKIS